MSITIFGYGWILTLICVFIQKNAKYMITMTLFSMVFQASSVFLINGQGVGPQIPTCFAMIVWAVVHSAFWKEFKLSFSRRNKVFYVEIFLLAAFCIVILVSKKKNVLGIVYSDTWYLLLLQLVIYMVCFVSMWSSGSRITTDDITGIFEKISIFVMVIGLLQFLVTTNILSRNVFWETFLYTPDTQSAYYWYSYYPRLFSTFMEPSYCGVFLVAAFYYNITINRNKGYIRVVCIVLVLEILLSFSSTAYGAFAIGGVIYLIFSSNKKALKYLIPIGIAAVSLLTAMGTLITWLNMVIFSKGETGSAVTRHNWNEWAYEMFLDSPVWGAGYRCVRASSLYYSVPAQLGMAGSVVLILFLGILLWKLYTFRENKECSAIMVSLCAVIVALIIAVPDIDNLTLWQMLYFAALIIGNHCKRKNVRAFKGYRERVNDRMEA